MGLNTKLTSLSINLSFWIRLVFSLVFKTYHALKKTNISPPINGRTWIASTDTERDGASGGIAGVLCL